MSPGETGHDGGPRGVQAEISSQPRMQKLPILHFLWCPHPLPSSCLGLHQVWHSGFLHSLSLFSFLVFGLAVRQGTEEHFQRAGEPGEDLIIFSDILTP